MSLRSPTEYENGRTPSHGPSLDSSFPRTRESRFVPHTISLDTRFRGYDVTQVTSSDRLGRYFRRRFEGHEGFGIFDHKLRALRVLRGQIGCFFWLRLRNDGA
jgi:hypothetical protein